MTYIMVMKSSNNLTDSELFQSIELITDTFSLEKMSKHDKLMLKKVSTLWFMIKLNDKIIGVATLYDKKEDNLKNITINKSHRQKGLCKWLLLTIKKFYLANKKRVNTPTLTVKRLQEDTVLLVEMYIKYGYKIYNSGEEYYYLELLE